MSPDTHTLGKYHILEEIGRGGFATVYQAEDISLERTVALKVLDPLLTRDPGLIGRFQQEAKVTAKLFHPNIAALFEVGAADGRYFLAMWSHSFHGRSDLYSLGVVAYELCTGKAPFAADTVPSLYYKIVHEAPLLPSQVNARAVNPITQANHSEA